MFALTNKEKLATLFVLFAFLVGALVSHYRHQNSPVPPSVPATADAKN
jgi:hypothetical protein